MEKKSFYKYITYVLVLTIFTFLIMPASISMASGAEATITGNLVNVRAGPSISHTIIDQLPKGSRVGVLEESNGWCRVRLSNGKTGWISKDLVRINTASTSTNTAAGSIGVSINGRSVSFDVSPFVNAQNRTMVPIRFISEELGSQVSWISAEQKVTIRHQGQEIELWIGKPDAKVNGSTVTMDTQAVLVNGRTMVPLRFISESFGANVEWQASNRMVVITTAASKQPQGNIAVVTSTTLNVRSGPGIGHSLVGQVSFGNEFKIMSSANDDEGKIWHQVTLNNGRTGWIAGWLVVLKDNFSQGGNSGWSGNEKQMAIVTGNVVNLRKGPGTSFDILDRTTLGDMLEILNEADGWYYVKTTNGVEGWIAGQYVSLQTIRDDRHGQVSRGTGKVVFFNGNNQNLSYPALVGLEYEEQNEAFFVTLKGNSGLFYSTMYLENPYRIVIDVQGVTLDLPTNEIENIVLDNPFIDKIRAGQFSENVGRIVLELKAPIGVTELNRQGEKEITFLFQRGSLVGKLIVIDPGHGTTNGIGISDPGAIGPTGITEREVVMDISNRLAAILTEKGAKVILTRTSPSTSMTLDGRVQLANSVNADLYVSVHANASLNRNVNGTSTYYYAPASDPKLGPQRLQRIRLAQLVQQSMVAHGGRQNLGIIQSSFKVIRETNMPSILVETAFISNPTEEKLLADPSFRARIARGIAEGIERYYN